MLVLVLGGCGPAVEASTVAPTIQEDPATVLLEGYSHVRQKPDFCGEACVAMAMAARGQPEIGRAHV